MTKTIIIAKKDIEWIYNEINKPIIGLLEILEIYKCKRR